MGIFNIYPTTVLDKTSILLFCCNSERNNKPLGIRVLLHLDPLLIGFICNCLNIILLSSHHLSSKWHL